MTEAPQFRDSVNGIEDSTFNNLTVDTIDATTYLANGSPLSTTDIVEGINKYYTSTRFSIDLATKTTDDVAEGGTNLYYTGTRWLADFDTARATVYIWSATQTFGTIDVTTYLKGGVALSTTDIVEGTNLYYTADRFNTAFGGKTTDDLGEGLTNLYYTAARFNNSFSAKTTDDLTEGLTNVYYTLARWDSRFATARTNAYTWTGKQTFGTIDASSYLLGGVALSTTDIVEGTNLYYTADRFNTAFGGKTTDDLGEGLTNLYYTTARFNTSFSGKTTDDLGEGITNLYYTAARFNTSFSGKTTDDLGEGITNLYFTAARWNTQFDSARGTVNIWTAKQTFGTIDASSYLLGGVALSTTDIVEGTNLYYTTARFAADLATKTTDDLSEGLTNLYYTNGRFDTRFASKTADDLTEGLVHVYYTDARWDSRFATVRTYANTWTGKQTFGTIDASSYLLGGVALSTTDIVEGSNLYYTVARFNSAFGGKTTDDLGEGLTNLYYTSARFAADLATKTTDDIGEGGTNLYYTGARWSADYDTARATAKQWSAEQTFNGGIATDTVDATAAFGVKIGPTVAASVDLGAATINTYVNATTESTSTATGGLVVSGGVGIAGNVYFGGYIKGAAVLAGVAYTDVISSVSGFGWFNTITSGFECGYYAGHGSDQRYSWGASYTPPSGIITFVSSTYDYVKFNLAGIYRITFQLTNKIPASSGQRIMVGGCYFTGVPNPGTNDKDSPVASTGGVAAIDIYTSSAELSGVHMRGLNSGDCMRIMRYISTSTTAGIQCNIIVEYYGPDA